MKRFIAILLVLCVSATPIYAVAESEGHQIMPKYEAITDYSAYFAINNSGMAFINFKYYLMEMHKAV